MVEMDDIVEMDEMYEMYQMDEVDEMDEIDWMEEMFEIAGMFEMVLGDFNSTKTRLDVLESDPDFQVNELDELKY